MMKEKGSEKDTAVSRQSAYYRQHIDRIKSDTANLKDQMSIESSTLIPVGTESYIARLKDQEETYVKKIKLEKIKKRDLDRRISEVQKRIQEKKESLAMPKDKKIQETNETILLKIKKIEHKLEKILQKYNEILARNKHLRDEVNSLRNEKKISEEILKNLHIESKAREEEDRLSEVKLQELKEESKIIKDKLRKVRLDKKHGDQEMEKFNKDWKEVDKMMDAYINSEELFKEEPIDTPKTPENEAENTEEANTAKAAPPEKSSIRDAVNKVEMLSEAFKKIEEATGISDVDEIVKIFIQSEEHNYSLFSHVNELTKDIQRLDYQILEMNEEIMRYNQAGLMTAAQREHTLKELESKLNFTEMRAEKYEQRYETTMNIITMFKIGIHQLMEKIGVADVITEEGVNEGNIMQYLGIIELRTNEVLQMFRYCQKSNNDSPVDSAGNDELEKKPLKITLPLISDKDNEEDDTSSLFRKQEFLEKIRAKWQ